LAKFYFICILLFAFFKVDAQLLDWKKILSGNIAVYKMYNIKSAVLIKDGKIINRVEIFENKNEIVTSNKAKTSVLRYDSENRINQILSENEQYNISYFGNGMIQSVEQQLKSENKVAILKNSRPDEGNLRSIDYNYYFINTETGVSYQDKKRFVFNQKDSLLSFREDIYPKKYNRKYFNNAEVNKSINEDGFAIDSTYRSVDNKMFGFYFLRKNNQDLIRKAEDSFYTEKYANAKIESRTVEFKGKLYEESFYNAKNIIKKQYIYYTADNRHDVLWEEKYTYKNGRVKSIFPQKKYYDLIDHKLIRNKKKFKNEKNNFDLGNDTAYYEKRKRSPLTFYKIFSPSVLFSDIVFTRFLDNMEIQYNVNGLELKYYTVDSNKSLKPKDYLGDKIFFTPIFYRHIQNAICKENYRIEITTNDGKRYLRKLTENPDDFSIILNIFGSPE
jgi:hypothetical protein